jgi:hypothetical protein
MDRCTYTNEVWYSEISWEYQHFYFHNYVVLSKFLSVAIVLNFEVMLGQMLSHCVWNYVMLGNVVS